MGAIEGQQDTQYYSASRQPAISNEVSVIARMGHQYATNPNPLVKQTRRSRWPNEANLKHLQEMKTLSEEGPQ
jgi:hypothetical protein